LVCAEIGVGLREPVEQVLRRGLRCAQDRLPCLFHDLLEERNAFKPRAGYLATELVVEVD
jgi:hypothetical protein